MGEKSEQIERHIEQTRNELGENINELGEKVKHAVDWRAQFEERPMAMMGAAFVGGMLLSALIPSPRSRRSSSGHESWKTRSDDRWKSSTEGSRHASSNVNSYQQKASETWENVKGALVGVAATKASDFLEQIVPGFAEPYKRRASKAPSSSSAFPDAWQKTSGAGTDYGAHS